MSGQEDSTADSNNTDISKDKDSEKKSEEGKESTVTSQTEVDLPIAHSVVQHLETSFI